MHENYLPLLGGLAGRTPVVLHGVPDGLQAVTIPLLRRGVTQVPRDRKLRTRVHRVDVLTARKTALFEPPPGLSKSDLGWVLSVNMRRWSTVVRRFGARADVLAEQLIRAGGVVLRCDVDEDRMKLGPVESWRLSSAWREQAPDVLAELRPRRNPDDVRTELLALLDEVEGEPRLAIERSALELVPAGAPFVVPDGTATSAKSWPTYEAALRAACVRARMTEVPGPAELAGHAWGDTHIRWSAARILVFSQLVGLDFALAVDKSDVEIRLRGPLLWRHGNAIADAARSHPWIGLPREGMQLVGEIECSATGVLIIENAETFNKVNAIEEVTKSWLCIWGEGKAVVNLADLVNSLPGRTVAAWMDLDAAGLEIFTMLQKAIDRTVEPIAMTLDLYMTGPPRKRPNREDQAKAEHDDKVLAAKVEPLLSGELAEVARQIVKTGKAVEQQLLHERVLPVLPALLESL